MDDIKNFINQSADFVMLLHYSWLRNIFIILEGQYLLENGEVADIYEF